MSAVEGRAKQRNLGKIRQKLALTSTTFLYIYQNTGTIINEPAYSKQQ